MADIFSPSTRRAVAILQGDIRESTLSGRADSGFPRQPVWGNAVDATGAASAASPHPQTMIIDRAILPVPEPPSWISERPYVSWSFLLDSHRHVSELSATAISSDAFASLPPSVQESMLVNELLNIMLGFDGALVHAKPSSAPAAPAGLPIRFTVAPSVASSDPALAELAGRLLPMCDQYVRLRTFAEGQAKFDHGQVMHAFCAAIDDLLRDYVVFVTQIESEVRNHVMSLQKLLFCCQPSMRSMRLLDAIVSEVALGPGHARGGALLTTLWSWGQHRTGDVGSKAVINFLLARSCVPFLDMLGSWIYEGRLRDPFDEFFIRENESVACPKDSDASATSYSSSSNASNSSVLEQFWERRFELRPEMLPIFLSGVETKAFLAGKYHNAIRECGQVEGKYRIAGEARGEGEQEEGEEQHQQKPQYGQYEQERHKSADGSSSASSNGQSIAFSLSESFYHELVESAFSDSCTRLLDLILRRADLLGRLASIKHYFLLDQGDFFVHFMDTSLEELCKRKSDISLSRLQSLLELSIRTSITAADPYKDSLSCVLLQEPLSIQLNKIYQSATGSASSTGSSATAGIHVDPDRLIGLESFCIEYKVSWPLNLVLHRAAMTKYQILFRHLFSCKHVERRLSGSWAVQQFLKQYSIHALLTRSYSLRQKMMQFLYNYEYYMMVEVLEPLWHTMMQRLRRGSSVAAIKTVEEVVSAHNDFLDSALQACLLTNLYLLSPLSKVIKSCLQYSKTMDQLILRLLDIGTSSAPLATQPAGHVSTATVTESIRSVLSEPEFTGKTEKMEREFHVALKELLESLSRHAQADTSKGHLQHLIARLDFNDFYGTTMGMKCSS